MRSKENPRPIIAWFVSYKKKNEFLTNKRDLKNIKGRQHVFICENLTPPWHKLLKYRQIPVLIHLDLATPEMAIHCKSQAQDS